MTPTTLFFIIISILIVNYIFESLVDFLNAARFNDKLPKEVANIYDNEEYIKSQKYNTKNFKISTLSSLFSIVLTLLFFTLDGFKYVDQIARKISDNEIIISLIFFGIIMIGSDILTTPFSYYKTFVIEEAFGFNKSTKKLFWIDKVKGLLMTAIIGGVVLALVVWFYESTQENFWWITWIFISVFTLIMNLFYSTLIVPLFNKQEPLEDGELKTAIEIYAEKVGFKLDKIFVIDGSKRSTKANAYFSGFGKTKRIVLYDTLINDLELDEIVAVLAHEVGHYKRKHTIFNIISSILITGITLFILSLLIGNPLLNKALNIDKTSFHIGLIVFGVLYTPISMLTGLIMNYISRVFEYQADNYAKETFKPNPLISSLKKLSKNSLSNLTPHPFYVFIHYSHPTLKERIQNLLK